MQQSTIILTEAMFATGKPFSQGEVNIWMTKYAPKRVLDLLKNKEVKEVQPDQNGLIVGHSETGHHHVLEPVDKSVPTSKAVQALISQADDTFMRLKLFNECQLVHLRGHDTHKSAIFPQGDYICIARQEQSPDGWQRVAD